VKEDARDWKKLWKSIKINVYFLFLFKGCSSLLEKSSGRLSAGEIVGIILFLIFVGAVTVAVILFFFMRYHFKNNF